MAPSPANADVFFLSSSTKIQPFTASGGGAPPLLAAAIGAIQRFITPIRRVPLLCSLSLAADRNPRRRSREDDEERVLISEVLIRNKDGEVLERSDLEAVAAAALRACRPNSALTVREVQDDVHRIVDSGLFASCMPEAIDTRDGIRLVFQVEPFQEFKGLICEGANVLPSKFLEDSFHDGYGKIINVRQLDKAIKSINGWYQERGLTGIRCRNPFRRNH